MGLHLSVDVVQRIVLVRMIHCRLKGGRYENVEVGSANTALIHLTGGVSFGLDPREVDAPEIFSNVDYCVHQDDGLVTCVTNVSQITGQCQSEFM